ncbi:hypothetical protein COM24_26525 [Bacillus toyonensis]|uniref:DUF6615 family protein n=1 Tax=Bacillus toyonensis TaxID=155322 RepID=UPI000BF6ECD1|nr:DUF6615 family protein [Bacillus toyonensis]PGC47418.1 hypothetical protein COM24_26525 [Bacillus toyonensis]
MRANSICECIIETSKKIWFDAKDYYESTISAREETYSESTLLELYRNMPIGQYVFKKVSIREEPENGADWEWYIVEGEYWIRFAVQAKRLFINDLQRKTKYSYDNLHHGIKNDKKVVIDSQCNRLLKYSYKNGYIPIYSFFNYIKEEDRKGINITKDVKEQIELLGWTYCFAERISPTFSTMKKEFNHIWNFSKPMKTLFCKTGIDNILREYNNIKFYTDIDDNVIDKPAFKKKTINELPPYVKKLMKENNIKINYENHNDYNSYSTYNDVKAEPVSENIIVTILTPVCESKQSFLYKISFILKGILVKFYNWFKIR